MELDGTHADVKFFGDLGVRPSSRDRAEHLFLTFCEGLNGLDQRDGGGVGREAARSRPVTPGSMSASP
jgi:hypothetical protein